MIHVQVTYRIRHDRLGEAEREISAFASSLRNGRPRFETYHIFHQTDDDASYIHVISFLDHEAQLEHIQSAHVKRFVENMVGLCEAGPFYTELRPVAVIGDSAGPAKIT